jgi:putative membrane protein
MTVMDANSDTRRYSDILAERRTQLAQTRTVLAAGRNLMAWVRTSLSLISFGFTIYKLLQSLQEEKIMPAMRATGPHRLGLFLIGLGTFPLIIVVVEYWKFMKQIGYTPGSILKFPSFMLAFAVFALGLILFVTILVHIDLF